MKTALRLARHHLKLAWPNHRLQPLRFNTAMKPETCVAIGTAHGYSACLIALALEQNLKGRLGAVAPHSPNAWSDAHAKDPPASLRQNLCMIGRAGQRVEIVRKTTKEAVDDLPEKIDFVFIDGDHSHEGARLDWETVLPRMTPFGVVVFHDTLRDRNAVRPTYKKWRRDVIGVPRLPEEIQDYPVVTIDQNRGLTLVQAPPGGESFSSNPPSLPR